MRLLSLLTTAVILSATITAADARARRMIDANGNDATGTCQVRSKTGATARVGCAHVSKFQGYVDDLENNHGSSIHFMGGTRRGKCWSGGLHPCGKALDVCQLSRGRVDPKCRLPERRHLATIASRHGLFEGGRWCHSDYGHAQVGVSAAACGSTYASARRRHRVASQ